MPNPPRLPGEDAAAWGARTGRFFTADIPMWRDRLRAEQRRVMASGGNPGPSAIEAAIESMYPALAPQTVTASSAGELDEAELYEALFGRGNAVQAAADDPDDEYFSLFPDEPPRRY